MAEYQIEQFKAGETILAEGDSPHCAYILKDGTVEISKKASNGQEVILSTLYPGDVFGEMSMVDAEPRSATVRALEDVVLIIVDQQTFRNKIEALDGFCKKMVQSLIIRLRDQSQMLADSLSPSEMKKAAEKGQLVTEKKKFQNVLFREDYREKINFGAIRFLLGDVNPQSRQGIKGGLHMQGFREIDDVSSLNDFKSRTRENDYDLVLLDSNMGVAPLSHIINDIRHNRTAISPYVIIFAVIDTPDPATLELLAEAGLDDVLVKPVALANIIDRVERRIRRRKSFVVTMDYVGPDRRSNIRPGTEEIPLVDVPNPLAFQAVEYLSAMEYQKLHESADRKIETLKVERYVVQIDWVRAKISTLVEEGKDTSFFLKRMVEVTDMLQRKIRNTSNEKFIPICEKIVTSVTDFQAGTKEMAGADWENFASITRRLKHELGPKR